MAGKGNCNGWHATSKHDAMQLRGYGIDGCDVFLPGDSRLFLFSRKFLKDIGDVRNGSSGFIDKTANFNVIPGELLRRTEFIGNRSVKLS